MIIKDLKHIWKYRKHPKVLVSKIHNGIFRFENSRRYYFSKYFNIKFAPVLYLDFPNVILCEITNCCNLRCPMCFQPGLKRKRGFMKMDLYKKVVDEVALYPNVLFRPFGNGEPLLHPDILDMVSYASNKGIKQLAITTNGLLLSEEISKKLLGNGLSAIEISLDTIDRDEYLQMRPGSNYDVVNKNVQSLINLKRESYPNCQITLNVVSTDINRSGIKDFIKYWGNRVDNIEIFPYHSWIGTATHKENILKRQGYPCRQLWERLIIYWNGNVNFCCNDPEGRGVVGNVNDEKIKEIWLGERYRLLRLKHIENNFKGMICESCLEFWPWINAK